MLKIKFKLFNKKILSIVIILCCIIASLYGQSSNTNKLIWPKTPEKSYIEFIKCIYNPSDFGIKESLWNKFKQKVSGTNGETKLLHAQGIAISDDGCLAISEPNFNRIKILNTKKNNIKIINKIGRKRLISPIDVVFDKNSNLYISDSELGSVYVLNKDFKLIHQFGMNNELERPTGIAINENQKKIYIVDTNQNCVFAFDLQGDLKFKFGNRGSNLGEFNFPTYICIDNQGKIYISDTFNFRIQVFNATGNPLFTFGHAGQTLGSFAQPKGIAVDSQYNIYVVDAVFGCFQIFNSAGQLLLVVGKNGSENGQFFLPADIIITQNDYIYISDSYNYRLQLLKFVNE